MIEFLLQHPRIPSLFSSETSEVLSNPEKRRAYDATLGDNGEGAAAQAFRGLAIRSSPPSVEALS